LDNYGGGESSDAPADNSEIGNKQRLELLGDESDDDVGK
jgi:hypothetical protein